MFYLFALLALVVAWNISPVVMLCALPIPARHKLRGSISLLWAACKGLLVLPANLLAPVVVPVALMFTPREANSLPKWAAWWNNDVSINGDHQVPAPLDDSPEIRAACYYAPGHHPRSFYARWVWLGLRNRASALAVSLGKSIPTPDLLSDADTWGDPATNRNHAGWLVLRNGPVYQLIIVKRISSGLCLRVNYGHKLNLVRAHGREVAMVINISISVLSWKG